MSSTKSVSITSPTSSTFSEIPRRASRLREPRDQADQLSPTSTIRATEEIPPPRTPSRLSINTAGHAAIKSSPATTTPSKLSFRRASRSPSPAGSPPTAPLPSLPSEKVDKSPSPAPNRVSMPAPSSATTSGQSPSIPTIPSLPSTTSARLSAVPLRQQVLRPRANTIPISPNSHSPPSTSPITECGKPQEKETAKEKPTESPEVVTISRGSSISKKYHERSEDTIRRGSCSTTASTPRADFGTPPPRKVTDSPLYGDVMSLRATHEEYVQSIRETHAMEKAELIRRIDQLEREARKREREIKGLRWLVMNANNGTLGTSSDLSKSLSAAETQGRFRSGSKSSELSQVSTASSGISNMYRKEPIEAVPPTLSHLYSPRTSTEEGLYELQSTVSDLIAPVEITPPLGETRTQATDSNDKQARIATRLRRANTLPDGISSLPTIITPPVTAAPSSKTARRTSSPILPPTTPPSIISIARSPPLTKAGTGLGIHNINIPSIPTSPSSLSHNRLSTTDTTLSSISTIPSLISNVSTASSSALSAIPESDPSREPSIREKEERDARRASRALKRLSASSTTASVGTGSSPYHSLAQPLSASQKPDKSTSIDDVLKKLRAFGGPGDH
ncbi:hypothetical protein BXZ70DRAFT_311315 [Cristinia sonorae]|uniref:Uncharacterized protein n=1 Tax=Cristinia sonorae TaxID=1940300 RepID=A0A8K0UM11_9AGAR|nr:hypothetical protein BXZ70DRAFT_311315 [Cristinia sonorae]